MANAEVGAIPRARAPIRIAHGDRNETFTADQPIYSALQTLLHPESIHLVNQLRYGKARITLHFGTEVSYRLDLCVEWPVAKGTT